MTLNPTTETTKIKPSELVLTVRNKDGVSKLTGSPSRINLAITRALLNYQPGDEISVRTLHFYRE